jgi:hypothetical protein
MPELWDAAIENARTLNVPARFAAQKAIKAVNDGTLDAEIIFEILDALREG